MYCISCKRGTHTPGARYCPRCGAPLQSHLWSGDAADEGDGSAEMSEPAAPCRRCGRPNPEGHLFCAFCGSRLDEGSGPAARPADAMRAEELVAAAAKAFSAGDLPAARAQCEQAVALDPRNAEGHAILSQVLQRQGSLGGALHEMTAALRFDPGNRDYERRLRELRDEQDRAVAPLLRGLDEPRRPRRTARAPQRPPLRLSGRGWSVPEWARAAALIGGLMLLLALAPRLVSGMTGILGLVVGVVVTLFVYRDARSLGMSLPVALLWAGLILITTFAGWYGLIVLLVYLVSTRMRR